MLPYIPPIKEFRQWLMLGCRVGNLGILAKQLPRFDRDSYGDISDNEQGLCLGFRGYVGFRSPTTIYLEGGDLVNGFTKGLTGLSLRFTGDINLLSY